MLGRTYTRYAEMQRVTVKKFFLAMLAALLLLSPIVPALVSPATAQDAPEKPEGLIEHGPIDPASGYPFWYRDANGEKLELCLDPQDAMCLQPFEMPDPTAEEVSFPENFPGESFWWAAEAEMTLPNGADAQLTLALEAAFGGREEVKHGDQMTFGRVRVRVDGLVTGAKYQVTHPYGTDTFIAEDNGRDDERQAGEINHTEDLGCAGGALAQCKYDELIVGPNRVGPFLKWDPNVGAAAPEGYVGNPETPHAVVGSPYTDAEGNAQNYFKVEQLTDAQGTELDAPRTLQQTDQFSVSGKEATLQVSPGVKGGTEAKPEIYNETQQVELVASEPEASIFWTTDPNVADENIASEGTPYTEGTPVTIAGGENSVKATELRYVAVSGSQTSDVYEKFYTIDTQAPNVTNDNKPVLFEPYEQAQTVNLGSGDPGARIFYTTDGNDPRVNDGGEPAGGTQEYSAPIEVARSQTIKAIAIDQDGNRSQVHAYDYRVAVLSKTGPIDTALSGYPFWYEDANGTRLELCLDPQDAMCLQPFESPDPGGPVTFPENFPGESFWWAGEAEMTLPNGADAQLTLAKEAAFAAEQARPDEQIAFGRVRIRIDGLVTGAKYQVTHPYGTDTFIAEDNGRDDERQAGEINFTEDLGCLMPSTPDGCNFDEARFSRVGPFLEWDPNVGAAAPEGYVGDPNVAHRVVGSPIPSNEHQTGFQNFFKVEGPGVGGPNNSAQTDLFSISGKIAESQITASVQGGTFNEAQQVALAASEPGASIFFTTDGSAPTAQSERYGGPIRISETATLKAAAFDAQGNPLTDVFTQNYVIDTEAPTVAADPQGGTFDEAQLVTLTANDGDVAAAGAARAGFKAAADDSSDGSSDSSSDLPPAPSNSRGQAGIYYTTDGTQPTTASTRYTAPIRVDETQTIKAMAVDAAGNRSRVATFEYVIRLERSEVTLKTPSKLQVGKRGTISGEVSPAHAGKVELTIERGGKQVLSKDITLKDSRYSLKYKPTRTGKYTASVTFAGDADHQPSDATKKFRVVRR